MNQSMCRQFIARQRKRRQSVPTAGVSGPRRVNLSLFSWPPKVWTPLQLSDEKSLSLVFETSRNIAGDSTRDLVPGATLIGSCRETGHRLVLSYRGNVANSNWQANFLVGRLFTRHPGWIGAAWDDLLTCIIIVCRSSDMQQKEWMDYIDNELNRCSWPSLNQGRLILYTKKYKR